MSKRSKQGDIRRLLERTLAQAENGELVAVLVVASTKEEHHIRGAGNTSKQGVQEISDLVVQSLEKTIQGMP